mgnify:CR=1 FL=1
MRKTMWATVIGIIVCVTLSGLTLAANPVKLIVNGQVINPDVPPEIKDDRVMVPIRWVAEALGAVVTWDEDERSVIIDKAEQDLQQQVDLLQQGLTAETPQEAARTWAKGVKNRNGAVQFAVLSPELKEKTRSHYESIHWVTGVSSPWVDEFHIAKERETGDGSWEFEIEFHLKTSTGDAGMEAASLKVAETEGKWYITQVLGGTAGVPNSVPDETMLRKSGKSAK